MAKMNQKEIVIAEGNLHAIQSYRNSVFNATVDGEKLIREILKGKKLKAQKMLAYITNANRILLYFHKDVLSLSVNKTQKKLDELIQETKSTEKGGDTNEG